MCISCHVAGLLMRTLLMRTGCTFAREINIS